MECRRFSQTMASEWQTAFVVSHKMPWRALLTAVKNYNKSLEKLQDFFFKTKTKTKTLGLKTKTKTFIFVLEAPRDQDHGLEDYITASNSVVFRDFAPPPCGRSRQLSTVTRRKCVDIFKEIFFTRLRPSYKLWSVPPAIAGAAGRAAPYIEVIISGLFSSTRVVCEQPVWIKPQNSCTCNFPLFRATYTVRRAGVTVAEKHRQTYTGV